jgi:antitoxin (DNA-binding transcriptional repressor) of toxin-antitoxin stability system
MAPNAHVPTTFQHARKRLLWLVDHHERTHAKKNAMTTVSIQEAQATLSELIHRLVPGEEIIITENDQPVARLVRVAAEPQKPPRLGTMRGTVLYMAPDFDAPLDDFREYME